MYELRSADEEFSAAWDQAVEDGVQYLEDEARRRATEGVKRVKRTYWKGELIDEHEETMYSDTLLIFLLKAKRPEVYRERQSVEHSGPGGGPVEVRRYIGVPVDEV